MNNVTLSALVICLISTSALADIILRPGDIRTIDTYNGTETIMCVGSAPVPQPAPIVTSLTFYGYETDANTIDAVLRILRSVVPPTGLTFTPSQMWADFNGNKSGVKIKVAGIYPGQTFEMPVNYNTGSSSSIQQKAIDFIQAMTGTKGSFSLKRVAPFSDSAGNYVVNGSFTVTNN